MNRKLLVRVLYNCGVSEEYDMCVFDNEIKEYITKEKVIHIFSSTLDKAFKDGVNGYITLDLTNGVTITIRVSNITNYSLNFVGDWED